MAPTIADWNLDRAKWGGYTTASARLSFTNGLADRRMQALVTFMRTNDFEVIVEGVETAEQRDFLQQAGIRMAQGWYFSPSLRADEFRAFFDARR